MAENDATEDVSLSFEELDVHTKRAKAFLALNFTETEAHLLAASDATPEDAQKLLAGGCTHKYATLILV